MDATQGEKVKRQLTAEQLENLRKGTEKAKMVKLQLKEIHETRRVEERQRKKDVIINEKKAKDSKREEAYNAVIELKNTKQSKKEVDSDEEEPQRHLSSPKAKAKSQTKSAVRGLRPSVAVQPPPQQEEPSEEEEEIEEVYEPPPRKTTMKQPLPAPSQFKRKPRPASRAQAPKREQSDAELYQNANMEILRKKFLEQAKDRLMNDLFNY